jgi:2-methylisocitrate lyase-like PEP mutase family enzyme
LICPSWSARAACCASTRRRPSRSPATRNSKAAVGKIRAALAARTDTNLVIIARSDAAAIEGLDAALRRGQAYQDAGADALFIEAPRALEDLRAIGRAFRVPLVANMVEGGATPLQPADELEAMGFNLVLYAGALLRTAALAMQQTLDHLHATGSTIGIEDRLISSGERNRIIDLDGMQAWADDFAPNPGVWRRPAL